MWKDVTGVLAALCDDTQLYSWRWRGEIISKAELVRRLSVKYPEYADVLAPFITEENEVIV